LTNRFGKLAVVETKPTTASGRSSSTADGRPDMNVHDAYGFRGSARACDVIEAETIMRPMILTP
jgi:hypothetical protein